MAAYRKSSKSAISFIVGLVISSKSSLLKQTERNCISTRVSPNSIFANSSRKFALRKERFEKVKGTQRLQNNTKDVDSLEQLKLGESEYHKAHYAKAKELITKSIHYSYVPPGSRPPG